MPNYAFEEFALGEKDAELKFTEYGASGLSSFKGLSEKQFYNDEIYDTSVKNKYMVKVSSLDVYLQKHPQHQNIILKVDTQGFELEVLKGSKAAFKSGKIKAVIIEVMTIEKYKGSALYMQIFDYLHFFGFKLFDLHLAAYEIDGSISEFDCVFVKD